MNNHKFQDLTDRVSNSKDLVTLQNVSLECYELYLDKIMTSEVYSFFTRMIVERFINLKNFKSDKVKL